MWGQGKSLCSIWPFGMTSRMAVQRCNRLIVFCRKYAARRTRPAAAHCKHPLTSSVVPMPSPALIAWYNAPCTHSNVPPLLAAVVAPLACAVHLTYASTIIIRRWRCSSPYLCTIVHTPFLQIPTTASFRPLWVSCKDLVHSAASSLMEQDQPVHRRSASQRISVRRVKTY